MTIEIKDLGLKRGASWLYEQVNLQIIAGEIVVLRGPNGSGKSSLLRAIAGFLPLTEGEILYHGKPLQLQAADSPLRACWYAQNDGLSPEFTAQENLLMMARMMGADTTSCSNAIQRVLTTDIFGLSGFLHTQTRHLSTGQRQRLALSCLCLWSGADNLWLLDEPNSGLDEEAKKALERLLAEHQEQGGMAVIASHIAFSDSLDHTLFEIKRAEL